MVTVCARHLTLYTVTCNSTLPTARRIKSLGLLRKELKAIVFGRQQLTLETIVCTNTLPIAQLLTYNRRKRRLHY
jgi:hypothetical protein